MRDARRKKEASIQDIGCFFPIHTAIQSAANSRFVSAELGYTGNRQNMLRARAKAVNEWEFYAVCSDGTYDYFVSLANGLFVSAEIGYTGRLQGMLRARATVPDAWERFHIDCSAPLGCSIQSAQTGLFVSAELGYSGGDYGMLRARAKAVDLWEQFN